MTQRGFTLIEVIIYLAIVSLLIGSGIAAAFYIADTSEDNTSEINIEAEAHFLLRKIEWALTGSLITSPAPGAIDASLVTDKGGAIGVITIDSAGGQARVNGTDITNDRVNIQDLAFIHVAPAGEKPGGVDASFTINGKEYKTTKYFRK